jgi:hypothetical protein
MMTASAKRPLVRASAIKLSEERLRQARNQNNRVQGNSYSLQGHDFFVITPGNISCSKNLKSEFNRPRLEALTSKTLKGNSVRRAKRESLKERIDG